MCTDIYIIIYIHMFRIASLCAEAAAGVLSVALLRCEFQSTGVNFCTQTADSVHAHFRT